MQTKLLLMDVVAYSIQKWRKLESNFERASRPAVTGIPPNPLAQKDLNDPRTRKTCNEMEFHPA